MAVRTVLCAAAALTVWAGTLSDVHAGPTDGLARAGGAVRDQRRSDKPRIVRKTVELDDASLETLKSRLGWFGINIPLELEGDVTTRLTVEVNLASLRDGKSYRILGNLSSKRLSVEGLDLQSLSAAVRYVDGRLTLDQLVVTVPDPRPGRPAGRATGTAAVQILPAGDVTAELRLDGVPLEPFARRVAAAKDVAGGRLTGKIDLRAPVADVRDIRSWRGAGELALADLVAAGRTLSQATTTFRLGEGTLTVAALDATIERERVTGSGTLDLTASYRYQVSLAVPTGDLSRLGGLAGRPLPGDWTGPYGLTGKASGSLSPFAVDAAGALTGKNWTAAGLPVTAFRADVTSDGEAVTLKRLEVTALDGRWTGDGRLGLNAPNAFAATLDVAGVNLARLDALPAEFAPPFAVAGVAAGHVKASGNLSPRAITGSATLSIAKPAFGGAAFDALHVTAAVTPKSAELTAIDLNAGDGRVTGTASLAFEGDEKFRLNLKPRNFDLARLAPLLSRLSGLNAPAPSTDANAVALLQPAAPAVGGVANGEVAAAGELPLDLESLNGSLSVDGLKLGGVTFDKAAITVRTENRVLILSDLTLSAGDSRLTGSGRVGLDVPRAFDVTIKPERFDLSKLNPLLAAFGEKKPADVTPFDSATGLLRAAGVVNGQLTAKGQASPAKLESLTASIVAGGLNVAGIAFDRAELDAATEGDTLVLSKLLLTTATGRLTADGRVGLDPPHAFSLTLRPDRFPLGVLRPALGPGGFFDANLPPISGPLSGEVQATGELKTMKLGSVGGSLNADGLAVAGIPFDHVGLKLSTAGRTARVSDVVMNSEIGRLSGSATVGLDAAYAYAGDLVLSDFSVSAIGRVTAGLTAEQQPDVPNADAAAPGPGVLPIDLDGLLRLTARPTGTLRPFKLTATGNAVSDELQIDPHRLSGLLRKVTLTNPSFAYRYDENGLALTGIKAAIGGGGVTGSANMPFADEESGKLSLDAEGVALADVFDLPRGATGIATGNVAFTLGPVGPDGSRPLGANAKLSLPDLAYRRTTLGAIAVTASVANRTLTYDVEGRLLDGPLVAKGTLSLSPGTTAGTGSVSLTAADLSRASVAIDGATPSFAGRLDVTANYDLSAATKATGTIAVTDVRSGGRLLTNELRGDLVWRNSTVELGNVGGGFAGGTVSLSAELDPTDLSRGGFRLVLRRADAARALGWIYGLETLTGVLNLELEGRLADLWRWQGKAEILRGSYLGFDFSELRSPVDLDASPATGAARLRLRRGTIRAAGGHGTANLEANIGSRLGLDLDAKFVDLSARDLLGSLASRIPGGKVSGNLSLSSSNLRSLSDLDGSVNATIRGGQASNLPIVGSALDVAKVPTGGGGVIDKGELRATVRDGLARVESFTLTGPSFRVFADGTVVLASERLNLDVVVDNSPARGDRVLGALLLRAAIDYATPIGWIERANRFIAERAFYLRVTGTVGRPVVRIRPAEQLQQETARFFIDALSPVPLPVPTGR